MSDSNDIGPYDLEAMNACARAEQEAIAQAQAAGPVAPADIPKVIELLTEMGAEHAERDYDGERDGAWWSFVDSLEDALGLLRGGLGPREYLPADDQDDE